MSDLSELERLEQRPVGEQRLLRLALFLRTVPPERFNLESWWFDLNGAVVNGPLDCNTTGCAVGWACSIPEFRSAGLRLIGDSSYSYPVYGGKRSWEAVQKFFDLTERQAERLFDECEYARRDRRNPRAVANRIESFVARATINKCSVTS